MCFLYTSFMNVIIILHVVQTFNISVSNCCTAVLRSPYLLSSEQRQ